MEAAPWFLLIVVVLGGLVLSLPIILSRHTKYLALSVEVICWVVTGAFLVLVAWNATMSFYHDRTVVEVALRPQIPQLPAGFEGYGGPATVVSGGADRATLELAGLSMSTKMLLFMASLVMLAVIASLSVLAWRTAHNLRLRRPFKGLARVFLASAGIVLVGAALWSILAGTGSYQAGIEAFYPVAADGVAINGPLPDGSFPESPADLVRYGWLDPAPLTLTLSLWPVVAAFVLAMLGVIFRLGEKMQKDTEGLV